MHRIGRVELFKLDPLSALGRGHKAAVAPNALVGDAGLMLGEVKERDGVEGGAEHQHASVS